MINHYLNPSNIVLEESNEDGTLSHDNYGFSSAKDPAEAIIEEDEEGQGVTRPPHESGVPPAPQSMVIEDSFSNGYIYEDQHYLKQHPNGAQESQRSSKPLEMMMMKGAPGGGMIQNQGNRVAQ